MADIDVLGPIPAAVTDKVGRMLAAHFSNQGLGHLIDEAADALGNPIVVVDPSFHYLAWHISTAPDDPNGQIDWLADGAAPSSAPIKETPSADSSVSPDVVTGKDQCSSSSPDESAANTEVK